MGIKQIKRNLNKHGFKLAGEMLYETTTSSGKPKLVWDMIEEEVPSIYLILWGNGESKTGQALKFASRLRHYQYWGQDRPQDVEHNRLMEEIREYDDVKVYYKPVYEMRWCNILEKELMYSPNLFEIERFFREVFGSKYK